ncbi:GDSL esterase/lipase [Canna indica]|uniref:GDSL esterase/lipase n=1 Tax=Canna indica TaxID=4628 RepID=A0AAQ3QF59_9LILI|nr:GDSL esterase/lipase [Canna indica]
MEEQIDNFNTIKTQQLKPQLQGKTESFLAKSLFLVSMGSNDYINNYLLPFSTKPSNYTPDAFSNLLIRNYHKQLMKLYEMGGRKFLVVGMGPLGCMPNQIANSGCRSDSCVDKTNKLAAQFNAKLKSTLNELNRSLRVPSFLYWDAYASTMKIINNHTYYGFKYEHKACCGLGNSKGQILCLPLLQCQNRSEYVFWDPFHPTDAFNAIVANQALTAFKKTFS